MINMKCIRFYSFILFMGLTKGVFAHGYISTPMSRIYACHKGANTNCGDGAMYTPNGQEAKIGFPNGGPSDSHIGSADISMYSQLDEQTSSRWSKTTVAPGPIEITWHCTACHISNGWEYYITKDNWNPDEPLARNSFELTPFCKVPTPVGQSAPTPIDSTHSCTLPKRSGYQIILGVWLASNTNPKNPTTSFYNVIDVNFSGENPQPQPKIEEDAKENPQPQPQPQPKIEEESKENPNINLNPPMQANECVLKTDIPASLQRNADVVRIMQNIYQIDLSICQAKTNPAADISKNQEMRAGELKKLALLLQSMGLIQPNGIKCAKKKSTPPIVPNCPKDTQLPAGGACSTWAEGGSFKAGDKVSYNNGFYEATQAHTAHPGTNWNPGIVPALWKRIASCSGNGALPACGEWLDGMAYTASQVVQFQGKTYSAIQSHTAWSGAGWNPSVAKTLWNEGGTCSKAPTSLPQNNKDCGNAGDRKEGDITLTTTSAILPIQQKELPHIQEKAKEQPKEQPKEQDAGKTPQAATVVVNPANAGCNANVWGDIDGTISKDKLAKYIGEIKGAASLNKLDWRNLAAVLIQETRGQTAEQANSGAGLAQCGLTEAEHLRDGKSPQHPDVKIPLHPEILPASDPNFLSPHNQIYSAGAYLGYLLEQYKGDLTMALNVYNKGENFSAGLGDPLYIKNHNDALSLIACFEFN